MITSKSKGGKSFPSHGRDKKPDYKDGIKKEGSQMSGSKIGMKNLSGTLYMGKTKPSC